jgi:hypothetical protein
MIDDHRASLSTALDFETYWVHSWSELLAEAFLYPPLDRVALEWSVSRDEVDTWIDELGLSTHTSEEYPEFGDLLTRDQVDTAYLEVLPTLVQRVDHPLYGRDIEEYSVLLTLSSAREFDPEVVELDDIDALDALPSCGP